MHSDVDKTVPLGLVIGSTERFGLVDRESQMIKQGMKQGPVLPPREALPVLLGRWAERLCQTLFWTLWMMSPLPPELAQPTLRLLSDLASRAHHTFTH